MSFYINNFRNHLQSKSQNIEQDYTEPVRLSETPLPREWVNPLGPGPHKIVPTKRGPKLIPLPHTPELEPPPPSDEYCEHGCWSDKEGNLHYIRCDENGENCEERIIPCGTWPAADCQWKPDPPNTPGPGGY